MADWVPLCTMPQRQIRAWSGEEHVYIEYYPIFQTPLAFQHVLKKMSILESDKCGFKPWFCYSPWGDPFTSVSLFPLVWNAQ